VRINEAQGLLTSVYLDWEHVLANPNGIRKGSQITWDNYIPQVLKQPIMASDVIDLFNKGQYTFQVTIDGSLIQMFYQYEARGNALKSASLAFYSSVSYNQVIDEDENSLQSPLTFQPDLEAEINDIDSPNTDILSREYSGEMFGGPKLDTLRDEPISWLRIDYDPEHARGVLHHDCHMHLSAFPYARLVMSGIPTPKQFIEFIMALCYPKVYQKHRLNDRGQYINEEHILTINSDSVLLAEHKIYRQMTHFCIPKIP